MSGPAAEAVDDVLCRFTPAEMAVSEVGYGKDAGEQRDILTFPPLQIAGAVVVLPVIPDDLGHSVHDLQFLDDAAAPVNIGLVELVLFLGDVPPQHHVIRQAHHPHFVEKARVIAVQTGRSVQPHSAGQLLCQVGDPLTMEVDLRDLGTEGAVHGGDDLEGHFRELLLFRVDAGL